VQGDKSIIKEHQAINQISPEGSSLGKAENLSALDSFLLLSSTLRDLKVSASAFQWEIPTPFMGINKFLFLLQQNPCEYRTYTNLL
jgi:hypothetical protein